MIILDENLSYKLKPKLEPIFGDIQHVSDLYLKKASDEAIWQAAKHMKAVIMSKDIDFYHRSINQGFPPKFIWINTGNETTDETLSHIIMKETEIRNFIVSEDETVFILDKK